MLTRRACIATLAASATMARAEDSTRLAARPNLAPPVPPPPHPGQFRPLGLAGRDAILYAPKNFSAAAAMPLLVMLHGSGDDARSAAAGLAPQADARGFLVLAPSSRKSTWDLRHAPACEDATFIDDALARIFASARVDASRIALMGISDGASFALSLGLANGDLFRDLLVFSAGYFHPGPVIGHPHIFISHGRRDRVLPFSLGERIAATLTDAGYDVAFRPFDGGHEIPDDGLKAALDRFLG
ncbi:MAG TPA: PHB depolymerase family esterase [Rhizomicrobium sp.]|jgi:predicted esterase|nr:PHB depolymerase family esterase [Rhizomicrobium sp.]